MSSLLGEFQWQDRRGGEPASYLLVALPAHRCNASRIKDQRIKDRGWATNTSKTALTGASVNQTSRGKDREKGNYFPRFQAEFPGTDVWGQVQWLSSSMPLVASFLDFWSVWLWCRWTRARPRRGSARWISLEQILKARWWFFAVSSNDPTTRIRNSSSVWWQVWWWPFSDLLKIIESMINDHLCVGHTAWVSKARRTKSNRLEDPRNGPKGRHLEVTVLSVHILRKFKRYVYCCFYLANWRFVCC